MTEGARERGPEGMAPAVRQGYATAPPEAELLRRYGRRTGMTSSAKSCIWSLVISGGMPP